MQQMQIAIRMREVQQHEGHVLLGQEGSISSWQGAKIERADRGGGGGGGSVVVCGSVW